jgi:alpha-tubulin suppressor-like RCC1 family protein
MAMGNMARPRSDSRRVRVHAALLLASIVAACGGRSFLGADLPDGDAGVPSSDGSVDGIGIDVDATTPDAGGVDARIDVVDASVDVTGCASGGTCGTGTVTFDVHPHGGTWTFCDSQDTPSPGAEWLTLYGPSGERLYAAPFLTDDCSSACTTGWPIPIGVVCSWESDDGGAGAQWDGTYFGLGTCDDSSSGRTCQSQDCAAPGAYTAEVCACPPGQWGATGCASFVCVHVPFTYPSCTPVEIDLSPPDGGGGDAASDAVALDVADLDVAPTRPATAIALGWSTSCALLADGRVACWGLGTDGELGNGHAADSTQPVIVSGLQGSPALTATALTHGGFTRCAFLSSGEVACWGDNGYGELQSPPSGAVTTPVVVPSLAGASSVSEAWEQSCALLGDGRTSCWGDENGPPYGATWPIALPGPAVVVSTDSAYGSVLLADGTVACWGINNEGELGNGTASFDYTTTAGRVPGLSGGVAVASGYEFTCALLGSGTVSCWGYDSTGQLGSGPYSCSGGNGGSCSPSPIAVPGLSGVTAIAAGESFACALLGDGTVRCWGDDVDGELGNGATGTSFSPVPVAGLSGVVAIDAAGYHACALLRDGAVYCWGRDTWGELGSPPAQQCADACTTAPARVPL